MTLDPNLALLFATTTGAAFLMMLAGVQKRALEWRRRRRFCPSCGRRIDGRTCRAH
jgi:NADH pyrophosphatase NudC (nudix superfamily)